MERRTLAELLGENAYPGRGILLGRSRDGDCAVAAYLLTGRSENSRNRRLVPAEDGVRIEILDMDRVTDASLILYHPVRRAGGTTILANGDHADTVRDGLLAGRTFEESLARRTFEPDAPHYTPRISGLLGPDGSVQLSILKRGGEGRCCRCFYRYDGLPAGEGRFLCTYRGDGDPLPSFQGEPVRASLEADGPETLAEEIWTALDPARRVALFVRYASLADGTCRDAIRNEREG